MPAKYRQIADSLTSRIRRGEIGKGSRLPGELDLAETYEVSRSTIRQALAELQQAGLIETCTGAGSFVRYDGAYLDDQIGWSEALARQGIETQARILRLDRIVDTALAQDLGLSDLGPGGAIFLALDRVRSARSGEAISLERSRLPWRKRFAEVLRSGLVENSLQRTLEALDIRSIGGSEAVELARLSTEEAALLGRAEGDAFLATRRTVHGADGKVVERVDSLLNPDHFKLQFSFGERPK
ncbi:GntR family transcriptional regulator [Rhizobiales bacterium GAS191]|nr:GntR family transcriptional regulator [Rhizobiales bacterium GAS191]